MTDNADLIRAISEKRAAAMQRMADGPAEVVKFYPADAAKSADNVLEQAIGCFDEVIIIGWDKSGDLDARATLGLKGGGDVLWLIEMFKHKLLSGDYCDEGQ